MVNVPQRARLHFAQCVICAVILLTKSTAWAQLDASSPANTIVDASTATEAATSATDTFAQSSLNTTADFRSTANITADASVLIAPWSVSAPSDRPAIQAPPPPPALPNTNAAVRPHEARARIEFVSDDAPVEVYLVVGTTQVTQWVTPGPSPTPSSMFGPLATSANPYLLSSSASIGIFGSDNPLPMQVSVERRRFLCRTPCAAELLPGSLQVHLRTRDSTLGTTLLELPPTGAVYRARTRSVGWYTLGQALLWTGVACVLAGVTLIGQSQASPCVSGHCGLYEGIGATVGGAIGVGVGIPLIVFNNTRIERLR